VIEPGEGIGHEAKENRSGVAVAGPSQAKHQCK
jgi:hypothetical protein